MKQRILVDEPSHEAGAPPGNKISSARSSVTDGGAGGALAAEALAAAGAEAEATAEDGVVMTGWAGELDTEPLPAPARLTDSSNVCTENVAVTECAWSMVTTQGSVPVQSPLQPSNTEPRAGVAVSVTIVFWTYDSLQSAPQLMPAGDDVTVPVPEPA